MFGIPCLIYKETPIITIDNLSEYIDKEKFSKSIFVLKTEDIPRRLIHEMLDLIFVEKYSLVAMSKNNWITLEGELQPMVNGRHG